VILSLLLFFSGLALIIVLLRARPKTRVRRLEDWEESKMELGARICQAAAIDAFGVHLDNTDQSLEQLDAMITEGWEYTVPEPIGPGMPNHSVSDAIAAERHSVEETRDTEPSIRGTRGPEKDSIFVLASYLGNILVLHHSGEWRLDPKTHTWPFVHFKQADLSVSPFEILARKLAAPEEFSLRDAMRRLLEEVERRTHLRVTSWHVSDDTSISFGPQSSDRPNGAEVAATAGSLPGDRGHATAAPIRTGTGASAIQGPDSVETHPSTNLPTPSNSDGSALH
jgi:hypothetical protein